MDTDQLIVVTMAFVICGLILAIFYLNNQQSEIKHENEKLRNQLQHPQSPPKSQELRDFLKDIDLKGYGVVRIDPDDMFFRSPRSRS